jgi:5-methyltetrahydropteroyltriglutamate--homocysteine methyltransferase
VFATLAGAYPPPPDATGSADAALRAILADQLEAGLELLGDGEVGAPDPIAAAVAGMDGVTLGPARAILGSGWAGAQPVVRRLPTWRAATVVARWQAATTIATALAAGRGEGPRPVRAQLLGPYTLGRLADRGRLGRQRVTLAFAEALGAELAELAEAGALVVQVDEPALVEIGPADALERSLAADAWRRLARAVPDLHLTLAIVGGAAEGAGPGLLFDAPFRSYLFDLCAGPDNWRLASQAPRDRGIIAGVADARVARLDSKEILVWGARYAAALGGRGLDRVGIAPSAGLGGLTHAQARAKIRSVGEAARLAGLEDAEELRRSVDPRAVDSRSAALGRYEPGRGSVLQGPARATRRRRRAP